METDRLTELIRQKLDVLTQLRDLSLRQIELVDADDGLDLLLRLLTAKQQLLNCLTALERQLDPFREQDPESRRWRSTLDRQRCADTSQCCRDLLEEVKQLEQKAMGSLTERRNNMAMQLQSTSSAAEAHNAYTQQSRTRENCFDFTSES